jgi:hypothetical protein
MSKRLQEVLDDGEFEAIRDVAASGGMTVSAWDRLKLRAARREHPSGDQARKLAAVRAGARHRFPTGELDQMLEEIEREYLG